MRLAAVPTRWLPETGHPFMTAALRSPVLHRALAVFGPTSVALEWVAAPDNVPSAKRRALRDRLRWGCRSLPSPASQPSRATFHPFKCRADLRSNNPGFALGFTFTRSRSTSPAMADCAGVSGRAEAEGACARRESCQRGAAGERSVAEVQEDVKGGVRGGRPMPGRGHGDGGGRGRGYPLVALARRWRSAARAKG